MPNSNILDATSPLYDEDGPCLQSGNPSPALKRLADWSPRYPVNNGDDPPIQCPMVSLKFGITSRQLYHDLKSWSELRAQIRDKYLVALGDSVNDGCAASTNLEDGMTEILAISGELREVLDKCVDTDTNQENIEDHFPTIRRIIRRVMNVRQTLSNSLVGSQCNERMVFIDAMEDRAESLLERLDQWGQMRMEISNRYVALGDSLNVAVAAFFTTSDTSPLNELFPALEKLRAVLEICLANDFIPEDAVTYLPAVASIIARLSKGVRERYNLLPHRRVGSENKRMDRLASRGPVRPVIPLSTGRHIHMIKGNERPKAKPRPPHSVAQMDDKHEMQASQTEEDKD